MPFNNFTKCQIATLRHSRDCLEEQARETSFIVTTFNFDHVRWSNALSLHVRQPSTLTGRFISCSMLGVHQLDMWATSCGLLKNL